ncbi:hypothetical protein ZWY2020_005222 [Hordeum vulgare]|nr:hypothetical protein ZWY2020_005222 [Hordeum vulgare]
MRCASASSSASSTTSSSLISPAPSSSSSSSPPPARLARLDSLFIISSCSTPGRRATRSLSCFLPRQRPPARPHGSASRSGQPALLRIRADNIYLYGYRSSDGPWSEFPGCSLIAGATPLSFGDSYGDMASASGT